MPIPPVVAGGAGLAALLSRYLNRQSDIDVRDGPAMEPYSMGVDRGLGQYGPPVVTNSASAVRPGSAGVRGGSNSLMSRVRGPQVEATSEQSANTATSPTEPAAPTETPQGRDGNDRLADFGFAMAASSNPSFFGQLGEAGLAMRRGDREGRQDSQRDRQLSTEETYRRAQADLARAELAWQQDPNNPRNIALLADARYRLAMADKAARSGDGDGEGGGGRVVARELGEDGTVFNVFRDGSVRQATLPDGTAFRRGESPGTMDQQIARARTQARQELATNPMFAMLPEERQAAAIEGRTRSILEEVRRQNTVRQNRGGPSSGALPQSQSAPAEQPRTRVQYR